MLKPVIHLFIDVLSIFHTVTWKSLYIYAPRGLTEALERGTIHFIVI
jgi:hypothetical protein